MTNHTLTAIEGIRVGHAHNLDGPTGCTVVLCPPNTVGGVDQRGGAPGTRETDLLRPLHMVEHVHAILLAGGSAYGLDAAGGAMRYLEEQGVGYNVGVGVVPIIPAAIIFDLDVGDPAIRPDAAMGYAACQTASPDPVSEGCVGAGAGAKVGALMGRDFACKSGIGSAIIDLGDGLQVGALFVANALGDVIGADGQHPGRDTFTPGRDAVRQRDEYSPDDGPRSNGRTGSHRDRRRRYQRPADQRRDQQSRPNGTGRVGACRPPRPYDDGWRYDLRAGDRLSRARQRECHRRAGG